jgi:protein-S-isoprenylcysteine O-methyltransferase Ste14
VWKRTNIDPLVFKGTDSAHDYLGRIFKLLLAAVAAYSTSENLYEYLTPVTWLERRWLRVAGVTLLLLSLVWTVVAQAQMG